MTRFTKAEVQKLRKELNEAMNAVAEKYGARANIGNISFGIDVSAKFNISRISENEHGEYVHSKEAQAFLNRAESEFGLKKDVLNEPCKYKGKTYVITGYNTRAKRYPIEITENGKPMKAGIGFMKTFVRAERPELFL